jgi:hypothetical protein
LIRECRGSSTLLAMAPLWSLNSNRTVTQWLALAFFRVGAPAAGLAATLRSHALIQTAEGAFFREVLVRCSERSAIGPSRRPRERSSIGHVRRHRCCCEVRCAHPGDPEGQRCLETRDEDIQRVMKKLAGTFTKAILTGAFTNLRCAYARSARFRQSIEAYSDQ